MSNPEHPEAPASGFASFGLDERLQGALDALGFETPTPIQAHAMPPLLEGRDVIGRARTGSGKTAAFGLPLLERLKDGGPTVRGLVLAPTRELALQVTGALRSMAKGLPVRVVTIYGGAPYPPQLDALARGAPVVVGTPGRVLDHVERGSLDLSQLEVLVLDEADEMLRMGFFEDVERVLAAAPPDRQVALFSATMPDPIREVAESRLNDPVEVQVETRALSVGHIEQRALLVPARHKLDALTRLLASEPIESALVFARTRAGCAEAADLLAQRGLQVDALHGDLNQAARERVLMRFRAGGLKIVIATDVAARGIDVDSVSHVFNLDLPTAAEAYVHRIGRTGRAGRDGIAISLVTPAEVSRLRFFQRALDVSIDRGEVPSDAEIAGAERVRLLDAVRARVGEDLGPGVEALLADLTDGVDPREVAAAALSILADDRGLELDRDHDERPPKWARRSGPQDRPGRPGPAGSPSAADEVELFLPIGKRRGVRPGDLVGAIANELGIDGGSIGRVSIFDHKSFVRVTQDAADSILGAKRTIAIRGSEVPISKARPNSGAGPRPPRGGPRGSSDRHKPGRPPRPGKPGKPKGPRPGKPPRTGKPKRRGGPKGG